MASNNEVAQSDDPKKDDATNALYQYIRVPEFKRILNKLVYNQEKERFRSVAVLSQNSREGKTFVVSALAVGYAMFLRRRVLIMDTISQTQNESFFMGRILGGYKNIEVHDLNGDNRNGFRDNRERKGVIDLLTTRSIHRHIEMYQSDPGKRPEPPAPRLDDSPVPDTADFRIGELLSFLSSNYDLILLDTCAISQSSQHNMDPLILARQANTSLLVTSPESIERENLTALKTELKRSEVNLMGTIYNHGAKNG